jgi:hypothetical protein
MGLFKNYTGMQATTLQTTYAFDCYGRSVSALQFLTLVIHLAVCCLTPHPPISASREEPYYRFVQAA